MKTNLLLFICCFFAFQSIAQKNILAHDLRTGAIDTLISPTPDPMITLDKTDFFVGNFDDEIEFLPETEPTQNLFPNSRSTIWERVADNYSMSEYPMRTNAKLLPIEDNVFQRSCSGNMVSRRHLLTSAQCVFNIDFDKHNVPQNDSILVCPGYDNGEINSDFGCSYARKLYAFDNWSFDGEDMALVELAEPLGDETGWIGFGFDQDDDFFTDRVFHKFTYPTRFGFPTPPVPYTGDTIYHTYGALEAPMSHFIWAANRNAMTGEEGTSMIYVENEENYTSYGTLTYHGTMLHSRIDPWEFAALKKAIDDNISPVSENDFLNKSLQFFPNPTADFFKINLSNFKEIDQVQMTDIQGNIVKSIMTEDLENRIDISDLPNGMYFLSLKNSKGIFTGKVIKASR